MESYYTIIKILHLVGMASWFGVALAISIVLSKKDTNDHKLILDLTTKVEMPASFFIPLTGVLMMICLLYTSPSPRDATLSRMPSSA